MRKLPVGSIGGSGSRLKRNLGAFELTMMGIGVIIGSGIFVITGVAAAEHAGPGHFLWPDLHAGVLRSAMLNWHHPCLHREARILLHMWGWEKSSAGLSDGV